MADAVGLVLSVVATWQTCVTIFDIVGGARAYGLDYEICRARLEVERVRLLAWGEAVGLNDSGSNRGRNRIDPRLKQEHTRKAVAGVLGCIVHVFEDTESLQNRYGLIPDAQQSGSKPSESGDSSMPLVFRQEYANLQHVIRTRPGDPTAAAAGGSSIRKALSSLKRIGKERQRAGTSVQKMTWAIHDRSKFQKLVMEIRQFNDNLSDLFPDLHVRDTLRAEVTKCSAIRPLTLLQEATADSDVDFDLSDAASQRLDELGATVTARSILSGGDDDGKTVVTMRVTNKPAAIPAVTPLPKAAASVGTAAALSDDATAVDILDQLEQKLDNFYATKREGALNVSLMGPYAYSEKVSAYVGWESQNAEGRSSYWDGRDKGMVATKHAAFELYYKKKFIQKRKRDEWDDDRTDEDGVLLDPESSRKYENVNPGTVTIEGFALDCWDYEEQFGKPRSHTFMVSTADVPSISAARLMRRLDQLRGKPRLGWNPDQDDMDLEDFLGTGGVTWISPTYAKDPTRRISDLYSALNRTDFWSDLSKTSTISIEWQLPPASGAHGLWNFLWQMILGIELARRMEQYPDSSMSGLTVRVLSAVIISDLWINNAELILKPFRLIISEELKKKVADPANQKQAQELRDQADSALSRDQYQEALDLYTKSVELNPTVAACRNNVAKAFLGLNKFEEAQFEAHMATELDPKMAEAWEQSGKALIKLEDYERAVEAYEKAINLHGSGGSVTMKSGIAEAKREIKAWQSRFDSEKDEKKQHKMQGETLDQRWDLRGSHPEYHSRVHEQQVAGLLMFAEKMKWPYLNEARDFAESVYPRLRAGETISNDLADWYFGLMLPGKWMSFKIMTALVKCSPSIAKDVPVAPYYDSCLLLKKYSYWRLRTALGRVLGALPGVQSLCGWVGPCPPVEFSPSLQEEFKPRYIRLKARRFASTRPVGDDDTIHIGGRYDRYVDTRPKPDEDLHAFMADMTNEDAYITPEPPVKQLSTVTVSSIRLMKLAADVSVAHSNDAELEREQEYRASILFSIDNNESPVSYTLYTNPLFVTPPPCRVGPNGEHQIHMRERKRYQMEPWDITRLKEHTPDDETDGYIMVINATGAGAEVLARAWCAERGQNALIRRAGGPCYVCAVKATMELEMDVLIWVG